MSLDIRVENDQENKDSRDKTGQKSPDGFRPNGRNLQGTRWIVTKMSRI